MERAACRAVPTSVFFPGRGETNESAAKAVCGQCPVRDECASYASAIPGLVGIWGGLSERERGRQRCAPAAVRPEPARAAPVRSLHLWDALELQRAHPGHWVWLRNFASLHSASAVASDLRSGTRRVPPGRWDFVVRANGGGGSDLYARYVGTDECG